MSNNLKINATLLSPNRLSLHNNEDSYKYKLDCQSRINPDNPETKEWLEIQSKINHIGDVKLFNGILEKEKSIIVKIGTDELLNKEYDNVGFTVHVIDSGVDTGPIIRKYYIDPFNFISINILYKHIEYSLANAMVEGILEIFSGNVTYEVQKISLGRQYYTITKELRVFAEKKFDNQKKIVF
jgi:hypothetical protein